jgi:hypothetical protein
MEVLRLLQLGFFTLQVYEYYWNAIIFTGLMKIFVPNYRPECIFPLQCNKS